MRLKTNTTSLKTKTLKDGILLGFQNILRFAV